MKCLRCPKLGREKPNETGKLIDGVPVCSTCLLQDAKGNRNHVIDYSFLKAKEKSAPLYVSEKPPKIKK